MLKYIRCTVPVNWTFGIEIFHPDFSDWSVLVVAILGAGAVIIQSVVCFCQVLGFVHASTLRNTCVTVTGYCDEERPKPIAWQRAGCGLVRPGKIPSQWSAARLIIVRCWTPMKVSVDFSWQALGDVEIEDAMLRFPSAPESPGMYRFDLGQSLYVGETDRLRRRFQHYRTPGPTQSTNIRLRDLMLEHLHGGKIVSVFIVTYAVIAVDGVGAQLDLAKKASRLLLESAVLSAAHNSGQIVENL